MTTGAVQVRGHSFPPTCRLHCRKEYERVRQGGNKRHLPHFLVVVFERPNGPTRLGLTVSRKIGGAVVRNRIKRCLREFFRIHYSELPTSLDIVIVAKKGAAALSTAEVFRELEIFNFARAASGKPCSKNSLSS